MARQNIEVMLEKRVNKLREEEKAKNEELIRDPERASAV